MSPNEVDLFHVRVMYLLRWGPEDMEAWWRFSPDPGGPHEPQMRSKTP